MFNCDRPNGVKLITRLDLGLTQIGEHTFSDIY